MAPNCKQSKCPSAGEWINKLRYVQTTEYNEKDCSRYSDTMDEHLKRRTEFSHTRLCTVQSFRTGETNLWQKGQNGGGLRERRRQD